MKKRNDKIVMMFIVLLVFLVMSWVVPGGMFNNGTFTTTGYTRLGLFDIIAVIYSAFYYKLKDLFYIFTVGGCYGILSQTKSYRKLVDKASFLIKGKEAVVFAVITLVMGVYVSLSSQILSLFWLTPFIITIFLRNGYDRLTALSAGFGGTFIGYLGLTFGTFGVTRLNELTGIGIQDWIWVKIAIFIAAYILYTIFAILYMVKTKKVDSIEYDLYHPLELDETKVKKRHKAKVWPLLIVFVISFLVVLLGYINWVSSFGIKVFDEFYTTLSTGFKVGEVPVFGSIMGSYMKAFGAWDDLLFGSFVILFATILIALFDKVKVNVFLSSFGEGAKKISKVAFIYGFAFIVVFLASSFPWQNTLINMLFGNGTFNVAILLIIGVIAQILVGDPDYLAYAFSSYLTVAFADNIVAAGLIWRLGSAIALIVGPTSFLLLTALTYLDVPYTKWLKYIWKFILSFVFIVMLILVIVIYL